ncbi:MAG: hypothetical protein LUC16_03955 [Coprobacillus sp.]|nr:hypothetical protein [Coprobacillus sp.]
MALSETREKDEELIRLFYTTKDEHYRTLLKAEYEKRLSYIAHQYLEYHYHSGITYEELYAAAIRSFYVATSQYIPGPTTNLYSYWKTIANRTLSAYIRDNSYEEKARAFDPTNSLDKIIETDSGIMLMSEVVGEEDPKIKNDNLIDDLAELREGGVNFREIENDIIKLLIYGYKFSEICELLGISDVRLRSITRTIKRKCANSRKIH